MRGPKAYPRMYTEVTKAPRVSFVERNVVMTSGAAGEMMVDERGLFAVNRDRVNG